MKKWKFKKKSASILNRWDLTIRLHQKITSIKSMMRILIRTTNKNLTLKWKLFSHKSAREALIHLSINLIFKRQINMHKILQTQIFCNLMINSKREKLIKMMHLKIIKLQTMSPHKMGRENLKFKNKVVLLVSMKKLLLQWIK
jgi:hypothetical protein